MIAKECGLKPGTFVWSGGDTHIYSNHFEQIKEQLTRTPRALPRIVFNREVESVFDYKYEDISLVDYDPYPPIKGAVSV